MVRGPPGPQPTMIGKGIIITNFLMTNTTVQNELQQFLHANLQPLLNVTLLRLQVRHLVILGERKPLSQRLLSLTVH